ncbi:MAG TPA: hypothetical protein VH643_26260 [Gemmataceae bacterium]
MPEFITQMTVEVFITRKATEILRTIGGERSFPRHQSLALSLRAVTEDPSLANDGGIREDEHQDAISIGLRQLQRRPRTRASAEA